MLKVRTFIFCRVWGEGMKNGRDKQGISVGAAVHRRGGSFLASKHRAWPWTIYVRRTSTTRLKALATGSRWNSHKLRRHCYSIHRGLHEEPSFKEVVESKNPRDRSCRRQNHFTIAIHAGSTISKDPLDKYRASENLLHPLGHAATLASRFFLFFFQFPFTRRNTVP